MNNCSNLTNNQFRQSLNASLYEWLVSPTEPSYTCQDWIGDLEEEITTCDSSDLPAPVLLPAIDPDEFEVEFCWYLS